MTDVTVRQLAEKVGATVDRLLRQIAEAGLPQTSDDEAVTEDQRQKLLAYLKQSHGSSISAPKKIILNKKSVGTLRTGQGRAGRNVAVEVRRKRTYVKRPESLAEKAVSAEAPQPSQAEEEARRIRAEEIARKAAEQESRRLELERKAEEERRREEEAVKLEAQRKAEAERQAAEQQAAQEKTAKGKAEKLTEQIAQAEATPEDTAAQVAAAAAEAQARAQASEKSGKRGKAKDRERAGRGEFGGGRPGRRELSLKSQRRVRRRTRPSAVKLEQHGGEFKPTEFIAREVELPAAIAVGELAQRMSVKAGEVIKTLMGLGVMATINQTIDQDVASLVVEEMGHRVKLIHDDAIEQALEQSLKIEGEGQIRAPVVTVMGHVDHGKTSLLDFIRNTRVVSGEAGGITQHIGAYAVEIKQGRLTFIDTPGHAAFSAMRARGAVVTDIVVLVVAADDGVMPQTEEAIQHAKAADVPIVVAVNKIDLPGANPDQVSKELAAKGVAPEDWGGDTQFVRVSAVTGEGIDELLEAILLQAELLELKAVPDAPARGVVIESRLDRGRGPVSTVLVQNGSLKQGDIIIAGEYHGRVRAMLDDQRGQTSIAGPSQPVEVLGLSGTPGAGDSFSVVTDERSARDLAEFRRDKSQEQRQAMQQAAKLDNLFANLGEGEKRILKLVVKADVRGSLEAIVQSLADLGNDEVSLSVLGSGVGAVTESDVNMALTYGAAVFGFNVRTDNAAKALVEREGIDVRYYSVIYEMIDDVKQVLSGMLAPETREEILGIAEVREVFRSPRFGQIAGCMVTEGSVFRHRPIRVLRDSVVIYEGELESLRRFKDDVQEVRNGTECGIGVRNYNDVRAGDLIEVFESREVARAL